MTTAEKMELIAETLEVEVDEITEDTELEEFDSWDSMTKLSLIVMFDDEFDKKITSDDIRTFTTIGDILNLMD